VGRFDRNNSSAGLPESPSPGAAAQSLRATLEEKLREIVETAEARAHEIEDRALERAHEIEQDSERKARERFRTSSEGAEQLLTAIDEFERDVAEAIRSLRRSGERLTSELEAQMAAEPATGPDVSV
jgi:vacuolar-type H+-ATPase subunit E/Vma4